MKKNGSKEAPEAERTQQSPGGGMIRRVRQPMFENDILTGGRNVIDSLTRSVLTDEQTLVNACLYIGQLERIFGPDDHRVRVALYKINGTMGIDGRARDEAVQAHAELFFPRHASEKDKRKLEKMQFKNRNGDDEDEKKDNGGR